MGTTIQPLTAEEVDHRMTMAALLQRRTLAQLKDAAEIAAADPHADPASSAQVLVELARRGEWSENALATPSRRRQCLRAADQPDEGLVFFLNSMPKAGFVTDRDAERVHIVRAEQWLRGHEARLERERKLVLA